MKKPDNPRSVSVLCLFGLVGSFSCIISLRAWTYNKQNIKKYVMSFLGSIMEYFCSSIHHANLNIGHWTK
jgi:hypothetical protein